jgi:RNA polymerase sigma-70 factor (ECF subfamily)
MDTKTNTGQVVLGNFLASVERRALVIAEVGLRNPDDAMDVVQEAMTAFVRAYANKPEVDWAPLFHRVLQNKILDWHRRAQLKRRHFMDLWWDEEQDETNPLEQLPDRESQGPESRHLLNMASESLAQAVEALPLRQRQAVMLRIWEGLDVAETASAMGCSDGSVKTHLSRALKALRAKLEEHW